MNRGLKTVISGLGLSALLFLGAAQSAFAITDPTYDGSSITRGVSNSFNAVVKVAGVAQASCAKLPAEADMTKSRIAIFMTDVSSTSYVHYDTAVDTAVPYAATVNGDPTIVNDAAPATTCTITFKIKVTETVPNSLSTVLKNHSNTINFYAAYYEGGITGTSLSKSTTPYALKATASVVQAAPIGFSAAAGDSKATFRWSGTSTGTVVTDTNGTTASGTITGVMLVAISNTAGPIQFPTYAFNPDPSVTSDTVAQLGTCFYNPGFNDGSSCVSCTDSPNNKYYITNDDAALRGAGAEVFAVPLTDTSLSKGEIPGLTIGKTYSVFMFNMPGGLNQTACYRVTPYEGESYAQANGESKNNDNPRCFVATAAYGSPLHKNIKLFTWFRSNVLLKHGWGRSFVHWYNIYGPQAAQVVAAHPTFALGARTILWAPALMISLWLALAAHDPVAIVGVIAVAMFAAGYMIRVRNRRMA